MTAPTLKRNDIFSIGILIVLLLCVVYYSYNISHTSNRIVQLEEELSIQRETFITVSTDHERLKNKTTQLRMRNLNLELLDERARSVLGYIRPDERLILP